MIYYTLAFSLILVLLTGCEASATPFPVNSIIAESTPGVDATTPTPSTTVRYALAANTQGMIAEFDLLSAVAQVEALTEPVNPNDLGTDYDVIAAFGRWPGASLSPISPQVTLIINTSLPPLDNPMLTGVIQQAFDPQPMIEALEIPGAEAAQIQTTSPRDLRIRLANAGWPDGFDLTIARSLTPALPQINQQLTQVGITLRELSYTTPYPNTHLLLVLWSTDAERAAWSAAFDGKAVLLDLFKLPISYWAVSGLQITFTSGGWPVPA